VYPSATHAEDKTLSQQGISWRFGSLAAALTALLCAISAFALWAQDLWLADLAAQLRAHYAAAGLLAAVALTGVRRPVWAAIAVLCAGANVWLVMHDLPGNAGTAHASEIAAQQSGESLRLAAINVHYRNAQYERVIGLMRTQRPDVAVLSEITDNWRVGLQALRAEYPYEVFTGAGRSSGVLLLSRWPIERSTVVDFGPLTEPAVLAHLNVGGRTLNVLGVHLSWPMGAEVSAHRNQQLKMITVLARATPAPLVVLGDFNITPWSPRFRDMVSASGLAPAAGSGWQPTWPVHLGAAGIQIDHVLVSRDVSVRAFERGEAVGSDHWPVLVEVMPRTRE
jgi:endonuclease/exonuclease/phosphatase (EEP) superfamily protein YafD